MTKPHQDPTYGKGPHDCRTPDYQKRRENFDKIDWHRGETPKDRQWNPVKAGKVRKTYGGSKYK